MFSDPQKNALEFGFLSGQKVVDLGSGAGHYAAALSRLLGPTGRVYAVDIDEKMLVKLKNDSAKAGVQNIDVIWGDIEKPHGTKLRDGAVDGAVFSNILFQLSDLPGAIAEAKRVVKAGGKVCLVEWADLTFLKGVLKEHERTPVSDAQARQIFEGAGLVFERSFDAGEHHYGHIYKLPIQ
jgi:ubiquinone/menaquinone biosynthesis C-methylase UbiE